MLNLQLRPVSIGRAASAFMLITLLVMPAQAEVLSFAATRDSSLPLDQYLNQDYQYTSAVIKTDDSTASVAIPTGMAKAQSSYGINRVAVDNSATVDSEFLRSESIGGPFATAISVWADTFTISGGMGSGKAAISAVISGQFGPKSGPSYGGSGAYYLFQASPDKVAELMAKPFEFMVNNDLATAPGRPDNLLSLEQNVLKPGYTDPGESLAPGSQFGGTLTGELAFKYGESFTLVSILAGYANDFGVLNSFNSAHFGISGPAGAALVSASNMGYVAAVPEPGALIMLLGGVAVVMGWARRRAS